MSFQPVMVDEPTVEDTIYSPKERYEVFHGVKITDGAPGSCNALHIDTLLHEGDRQGRLRGE